MLEELATLASRGIDAFAEGNNHAGRFAHGATSPCLTSAHLLADSEQPLAESSPTGLSLLARLLLGFSVSSQACTSICHRTLCWQDGVAESLAALLEELLQVPFVDTLLP